MLSTSMQLSQKVLSFMLILSVRWMSILSIRSESRKLESVILVEQRGIQKQQYRIVQFSSHTCGIIHASNSPKPLVVPRDPPGSNPLNLSRITDEKLTSLFLSFVSCHRTINLCKVPSNQIRFITGSHKSQLGTQLYFSAPSIPLVIPLKSNTSCQTKTSCDPTINFRRVPINFKIFLPKPGQWIEM